MLRHKKAKEAKAKENATKAASSAPSENKVSLLGIGGIQVKKETSKTSQRQTAAEIRVQRGKFFLNFC